MRRLFVFDMDGTLLPNTTACLEIGRATNTLEALHDLEARLKTSVINTKQFAMALHSLWGYVPKETVYQTFTESPKLANIRSVLSDIKKRGDLSCLITMSPNYFAEHFADYGFDQVFSSQFPSPGGELDIEKILTPAHKVQIARQLCEANDARFDLTVGFGDSSSDEPLFREIQYTVAVNATPGLEAVSLVTYRGLDLYDPYERILALIDAPGI
jgi:phosphoserine phosphatase